MRMGYSLFFRKARALQGGLGCTLWTFNSIAHTVPNVAAALVCLQCQSKGWDSLLTFQHGETFLMNFTFYSEPHCSLHLLPVVLGLWAVLFCSVKAVTTGLQKLKLSIKASQSTPEMGVSPACILCSHCIN